MSAITPDNERVGTAAYFSGTVDTALTVAGIMHPPFACFPVLFLFLTLGVLVAVLLVFGDSTRPGESPREGPRPRRLPVWFVALAVLLPLVVLLLLSLVTAG